MGGLGGPARGPYIHGSVYRARYAANSSPGYSADTDYIECHGTGTPAGDPIEVSAVANFLSRNSANCTTQNPLLIGSAKPSFGHSEAASGITSVIEATLALENLQIPATVGIKRLNPEIPWEAYHVQVTRSLTDWPRSSSTHQAPRASVKSFGYGGANAHCNLERAESRYGSYSGSNGYANGLANGYMNDHSYGHNNDNHTDGLSTSGDTIDDFGKTFVLPISAKSSESFESRVQDVTNMNLSQFDKPSTASRDRRPMATDSSAK